MNSNMSGKTSPPAQAKEHSRRHSVVMGLGLVVLFIAIYFGPALREQEPDYYDPARTALLNARQQFEESLSHEQVLIDQLKIAREELDSAITQLGRVADLDPAHRARIESLRASLLSIENTDLSGEASPVKLQQSYRDLLAQMDALIRDIDDRGRQQ